jgi:hypothetical protein
MNKPTEPIEPISASIEKLRDRIADVRHELDKIAERGWSDRFKPVNGLLTCGLIALHSIREEIIEHEIQCADRERGPHIPFRSRGVGLDVCPGCFVCGAEKRDEKANGYLNNIAAFVPSKALGEQVVAWFGKGARLDFRSFEPNWIQVKVGACDAHLPNLQKLHDLTSLYGVIREKDITEARQ